MEARDYRNVLSRFINGGTYAHDNIILQVDGEKVDDVYFVGWDGGDAAKGERLFREVAEALAQGKSVKLTGYRALQAGRPTESLVIDGPHNWLLTELMPNYFFREGRWVWYG